nr:hypothetical protein [Tanacetum cinerariifolium]
PKTKASVRKTQSSSDTTMPPLTAASTRLSTLAKGKQPAKSSKAKGLSMLSKVAMTEAEQMKLAIKRSLQQTHISEASGSGVDEGAGIIPGVPDVPTDESDEEISWKSSDEDENSNDEGNDDATLDMNVGGEEGQDAEDDDEELYRDVNINLEGIDSLFELTPRMDVQASTTVASLTLTAPTLPPLTIPTISQVPQAPTPPTTAPSTFLQDLPNLGSLFGFDHRLKTLEANFTKFMQTNQFAGAVSFILEIVERYMDQRINEAVKKILTEKMESNKSIHRSDEQRNLYKALVDAYESDKIILDTYRDTFTLKRRKASKTTGKSIEGSKSHHKTASESVPADEPMKTTQDLEEPSHQEFETGAAVDQPITEASQHPECDLAKQANPRSSFNKLMDKPVDFLAFLMNRLKVDTLTPELLAGPTYELMKGSCKSLVELEFFLEEVYKATTDQLDWNNPEGQQYPHKLLKPLPLIPNSRGRHVIPFEHFINKDLEFLRGGASSHCLRQILHPNTLETIIQSSSNIIEHESSWIGVSSVSFFALEIGMEQKYDDGATILSDTKFYGFAFNKESTRDVYSKHRIIAVAELQIIEWHNYKHLDWITMRRDDDKLYKFKEGDFKRLRIQDIEDMLMLLNKDKQNRLMRIDELHKFSDGMLNDVRTALDDHLKGIWMKYLPQAIWRRCDKERAATMIQAIDKQLKTRRIMRSLEKFVGGRLYEGEFRMLQRII